MSSPNVLTKNNTPKQKIWPADLGPELFRPLPDRRPFTYAPPDTPLEIIHADDDLLIVNKPAGLLSVPGKHDPDCLQSRLAEAHPESLIIHRLDLATSGVMAFARNAKAQRHLGLQFERRHVRKTYIARVAGHIHGESGRISLPIITDWPNRPRQMISHKYGRNAVTDWEVIAREDDATRFKLHPITGRSHQLRIHCWAMGHAILGDMIYGVDEVYAAADRLQLHAAELELRHPTGGAPTTFIAPCPF